MKILEALSDRVATSELEHHLKSVTDLVHNFDGLILRGRHEDVRLGSDGLNDARLVLGKRLKDRDIPFAVIPCTTTQFVLGRGVQSISKAKGGFFDSVDEALDYFQTLHRLRQISSAPSVFRKA